MTNINKDTKWVDNSQQNGKTPTLSIKLNLAALRMETKTLTNKEALIKLVESEEDTLMFKIATSLLETLNKNIGPTDENIKSVMDYILTTDEYTYSEYPCGSCFIEGQEDEKTCWRLVCQGNHCWCPTCAGIC